MKATGLKKAGGVTIKPPTESQEQMRVMRWVRLMKTAHPELELLLHVPNGGERNYVVAAKLKAEGVKKGFPDLFLPVARGCFHGLAIELKRTKGGAVKPEQKWWIERLTEQGYYAVVCRGAAEAIKVIETYLGLNAVKNDKQEREDAIKIGYKDGVARLVAAVRCGGAVGA